MTSTLFDADEEYRHAVEATGNLGSAFKLACAVGKVDWSGTDLTRAVLARMKSYDTAQKCIKKVLDKHYVASAADFFVETVAFYLKVAISIEKLELRVASEEIVNTQMRKFVKLHAEAKKLAATLYLEEVKTLLASCMASNGPKRLNGPRERTRLSSLSQRKCAPIFLFGEAMTFLL